MVAEFSVYDTPLLAVEHLFDSEENESLISRFTAPNNASPIPVNFTVLNRDFSDEEKVTAIRCRPR